ncbi:RNA pyrophosphohydrolase [Amorphus coralli]|uniref:RNA pyrophosphohydrolase n=1 Tax=Amorphus coralli TaxID=340680 RepID=UPI00035E2A40|nr:RNA pyrophosphohydrolase [Amorphus coralli]
MVDRQSLPYRPCVGVALFNAEGKVFIGERTSGSEHTQVQMAWQMPQGGIDKGEEPLAAAHRELYEETSISSISLIDEAPDWVTYDLPEDLLGVAWKGRYRGQRQKWFAFRFEGAEAEIDVLTPPDGHKPEFTSWRWEALERLPSIVVPFKRGVYEQVVSAFAHLAR